MPSQVPSPSATGWLIDLTEVRGPRFVVLRTDQDSARLALVCHLREIGAVADETEVEALLIAAPTEPIGVVW